MKKSNIIISGASGFIGTHLYRALADGGYEHVIRMDRGAPEVIQSGDIIVHLACSTTPVTSELHKEQDIKDNVVSSLRLLEICVARKIEKFIFLSSGGTVYGDHSDALLKEEFACNPRSFHGVMKLTIEHYIQAFHAQHDLPYLIARGGNVYGRRPDAVKAQGAIDVFLKRTMAGEPIEVQGDGTTVRDYIYIDDAVDFLRHAITMPVEGIFNMGTGIGTSLREILDIIQRITGKTPQVRHTDQKKFDVASVVLDIQKAKQYLAWAPQYSVEDGIRKLHEYYISPSAS